MSIGSKNRLFGRPSPRWYQPGWLPGRRITGQPAISLPLAMHSSGLPIGLQLGARHAEEHLLLQVGRALEQAMPWADRVPPIHVLNRG